ncbi:MAG: DUF479 domain-containing protein [Saprospiraceae bacterium]|nr:DUF479 domain-containing protein [Saprospiraceae bacterium]
MFLSGEDPDIIAGNYIADFVSNAQTVFFSEKVRAGILLHREIDHFTDNHPVISLFNARLRETQKKYAPVVTDIFLDYFLSRHWHEYHEVPLRQFADSIYHVLEHYYTILPEKLRSLAPRMIADDFLLSCSSEERLVKTLHFLARRARFDNNIPHAHQDLQRFYQEFSENFRIFFPEATAVLRPK